MQSALYVTHGGRTIPGVASEMAALATRKNEEVITVFNGLEVRAVPNIDPKAIVDWYRARDEARKVREGQGPLWSAFGS